MNKDLFSNFPTVDDEFDMVAFDCIQLVDGDSIFYTPIVRYIIRDFVNKKVSGGLTIQTAMTTENLEEIAALIWFMVKSGFFLVEVSALGTIYNEDMQEVGDVNWNEIAIMASVPQPSNKKQYLH